MSTLFFIVLILILIGGGVWIWPLLIGALGISQANDKPSALRHIAQLVHTYNITLDEINTALQDSNANNTPSKQNKGDTAKTLFIYLGAIFIFAGVSTYIGMFWSSMGGLMRIAVTLGVGYILLVVLVSALHENKFPKLILPLTLISALVMTGGWFVFVDEVFPDGNNWRAATMFVFGTMALHQGILFGKYQRTVLAFTSLVFIYGFMQVGLDLLGVPMAYVAIVLGASVYLVAIALEKTAHRVLVEPMLVIGLCWLNGGLFDRIALIMAANWASFIVGICAMLAAFGFQREQRYPRLIGLAYLIGSMMMYAGLFELLQFTSVELLYFAVTASMLYLCLALQTRALLLTTVIAMISYMAYFSAEYFADSLGWPITLVLMGVAFLGVGVLAIKVKRKIA